MKRVHVSFSFPWPLSPTETRDVLNFVFQANLIAYLSFFVLESFRPGTISWYFSLNTLLIGTLVFGAASAIWPNVVIDARPHKRSSWKDFAWMAFLALSTTVLIYHKTSSAQVFAKIVAPLGGLIVLGLSLLIYFDHDDQNGD